jgi:uncharacterized protein YijF (DUF1287 family)
MIINYYQGGCISENFPVDTYVKEFLKRKFAQVTNTTGGRFFGRMALGRHFFWRLPDGQLHAGVISDRKSRLAVPLVMHNSRLAVEETVPASSTMC